MSASLKYSLYVILWKLVGQFAILSIVSRTNRPTEYIPFVFPQCEVLAELDSIAVDPTDIQFYRRKSSGMIKVVYYVNLSIRINQMDLPVLLFDVSTRSLADH